MTAYNTDLHPWVHPLLDVLLRIGMIVVLAVFCYGIFHPFLSLMLWSVILAVTLYPLHRKLRARIGKDGRTATLIVLLVIGVLAVPCWVIANSLIDSAASGMKMVQGKDLQIPAPRPEVASWPVIGPRVLAEWQNAYANPDQVKAKLGPKLKNAVKKGLGVLANLAS